jgi:hypothetical protein
VVTLHQDEIAQATACAFSISAVIGAIIVCTRGGTARHGKPLITSTEISATRSGSAITVASGSAGKAACQSTT